MAAWCVHLRRGTDAIHPGAGNTVRGEFTGGGAEQAGSRLAYRK
jgi:hypothetical protein